MTIPDQEEQSQEAKSVSFSPNDPPGLLSIAFHTSFFPRFLFNRMRPKKEQKDSFASPNTVFTHVTGGMIILIVCGILIVLGVPAIVSSGSVAGWVISVLGAGGILAVFVHSIGEYLREGIKPSYDRFLFGVFFFFVFLGITAGIFTGTLHHLFMGLITGVSGFLLGYVLGILAGLWLQCMGWMAVVLNWLAGLAVLGMLIVDITLLVGVLWR